MTSFALHAKLGLSRNPFPPTPDAVSYFFTPTLQEQFSEVMHCIEARKGFVLLTGEVGLGKSTLVRRLMDTLPAATTRTALVFNTFLQGEALLGAILRDLGLEPAATLDESLSQLNNFLIEQHQAGVTCLLVIDDAQNLKIESLELIRLLCNLETGQEKLLQILLAGQPELEVILDTRELRQLKSRVVKHTRLTGLSRDEIQRYFEFRVNAAGSAGRIQLQPQAARMLHTATEGNLRRIHLVLDRCLYGLAALGKTNIDSALMKAALRDVSMDPAPADRPARFWPAVAGLLALSTVVASAAAWYFWQSAPNAERPNQMPISMPVPSPSSNPAESPAPEARATPPVPPPQATEPTVASPKTETLAPVSAGKTEEDCIQALGKPRPSQSTLKSVLPTPLRHRLQERKGLCLFSQGTQTWALWLSSVHGPFSAITTSPATLDLQRALVRQGQLESSDVDGLYGPRTASALAQFQASLALPITSLPDELTLMLLEKLDAATLPHRTP